MRGEGLRGGNQKTTSGRDIHLAHVNTKLQHDLNKSLSRARKKSFVNPF